MRTKAGTKEVMPERNTAYVDGKAISYCLTKHWGGPPVVLISGLGDSAESWKPIFSSIAEQAPTFAYDRPGYGKSAAVHHGKAGRDGVFVAQHLKKVLPVVGVEGSVILVAHSLGGLYALSYARAYPDEVLGLVLLDMRSPTFAGACERTGVECQPPWYVRWFVPRHVKAEMNGMESAEAQSQTPEGLGDTPVTLVTASKKDPMGGTALFDLWQQEQRQFADKLRRGRVVAARNSGHYVHHDDPSCVVEEVTAVIAAVQQARGSR